MKKCQRCGADRMLTVVTRPKRPSTFIIDVPGTYDERVHRYDVPDDIGIGGGELLRFHYCLDCGQIEGEWPLPQTSLEHDKV